MTERPLDDLRQLTPKVPYLSSDASTRALKYATLGYLIYLVVATVLTFIEVEFIVGMGPIACVWTGILLLLSRRKNIAHFGKFIGSTLLFCLCCFLLIYLLDWSPRTAQLPISCLVLAYTASLLFFYYKHYAPLFRTID